MPDLTKIGNTIKVARGETLGTLAAKIFPNQDVTRFAEILDLNPNLNVFDELTEGMDITLPSSDQIFGFADPIFDQVHEATAKAQGVLTDITKNITGITDKLPPQLQGYTKEALNVIGDVNGFLGDVETQVEGIEKQARDRDYKGKATNLINWLLSGKP